MDGESINRKMLCDIAHTAFRVVNKLLKTDQKLAKKLRSSETSSHQFVDEETITNMLAIKLLEKFPNNIDFTLFTHNEENQNGADWYWRIECGDHAIHARVQAKRVQRRSFDEPDALGYININSSQMERLLQTTHTTDQKIIGLEAWLVTYTRFEAIPPCGYRNLQSCELHHHAETCAKDQPCLWIANARKIVDSEIRNHVSIIEIIEHSVRLDCILPCIDRAGISGPSKKGFVLQSGLQSFKECVDTIMSDPKLRLEFRGALRIHQ